MFFLPGWSAPGEGGNWGFEESESSACLSSLPGHRNCHSDLHGVRGNHTNETNGLTVNVVVQYHWTSVLFCTILHSTAQVGSCSTTSSPRIVCQRRRPGCFSDRSFLPWPTSTARDMHTGISNRYLWLQCYKTYSNADYLLFYMSQMCNVTSAITGEPADWWRPEPKAYRLWSLCQT